MHKITSLLLSIAFISLLTACGGDSDTADEPKNASSGHVWKSQTDTIDEAKNAAAALTESMNKQEQRINNQ